MDNMLSGFSVDHRNSRGRPALVTIFSAPSYPQHCPRPNDGAVLRLRPMAGATTFDEPFLDCVPFPLKAAQRPEPMRFAGSDLPASD
jgi:hypothetical protein